MSALTRFVIENSRFTILLIVAVVTAGLSIYFTQPRQEDPEMTVRAAKVVAKFPGLSPERIEQLITKPIEEAIKQIPEIERIESVSMTGSAIITPEVSAQYQNLEPIWADLRNKMDDLAAQLPEGTQGPFVNDDFGRVSVATVALTGSDFSMAELYEVAIDVADQFSALPLVAKTEMYGVQDEQIWLELDPAFMRQFQLTPAQLASTIRAQNIVLPGGTVDADNTRIVIEPSGDFKSIDDLKQLSITTPDGGLVYLEDLATITRSYVDPPQSLAFYNGKPAIVFGVSMVSGTNVVEMGHQLSAEINSIVPQLPLGMQMDVAIFQPDLVQASVADATENLMQTMVVVLVVVMLFLGWRTGLIVGAMVPLTMMVTLVGMSIWAIELHRISIAAIIVALGLLVDNGVVIAEDIRRRMDEGMARLTAVLTTPKTLAVPLLTSSLTTVLAFMPLVLINDSTGEFLRSLGQVLSIALLSSWFLSVTITPALCYWFLSDSNAKAPKTVTTENAAYLAYRRFITFALRFRLSFILVMLAMLFAAGYAFQYVKQRSLGPSERNQFTVYVDLPAGTAIEASKDVSSRIATFLLDPTKNPEVTDVLTYVGSGGPRFFLSLSPNDPQPNKAFMVVNARSANDIAAVMERTDRFFIEEIPEANGRSELLFLGPAALGTVELQVTGPSIDVLRQIGAQISETFYQVDGIRAVRNDWENSVLKLKVNIDQDRARRAGVSSEEIARTLSAHYDGQTVTGFRDRDKTIPVVIRAQDESRGSLGRMRTVEVLSSEGKPVPILQIADFQGVVEPSKILRVNQKRALTIAAKHPDLTAIELYSKIQTELDNITLPPGYAIVLEGEIKGAEDSNSALFTYAPHAMFGILALLVLQFGSFRRSAIVLLTIPLILIGANFGLLAFRAFFDFTGMLGLFSLAGIIINNGIVLIDLIDQKIREFDDMNTAITAAAIERARPIVMTTLTTIVGLIPLALFGGEFWYGMTIVIMCGLGVGTVLTLGVVPVLYSLFFNLGFRRASS